MTETPIHSSEVATDAIDDAAQDWLITIMSTDTTPRELAAFKRWYAADPRHRAAYAEQKALWDELGALRSAFEPELEDTGSFGGQNVLAPARQPRKGYRAGIYAGGLVAACLALVFVAIADIPTLLRADFQTGVGEQASMTLADGSIAHLNTDSAIAVDYSAGQRKIDLLRGEAFFEVSKNPDRPFAVNALNGKTVALGTAFAVRRQEGDVAVAITEGRVRVTSPASASADNPDTSVLLDAGQAARYDKGAAPVVENRIEPDRAIAWRRGTIRIENLSLAEAIDEVDRYWPGKILVFADTGNQPINARLSIGSLDSGLEALATTHGLTVTHLTGFLTVIR